MRAAEFHAARDRALHELLTRARGLADEIGKVYGRDCVAVDDLLAAANMIDGARDSHDQAFLDAIPPERLAACWRGDPDPTVFEVVGSEAPQ